MPAHSERRIDQGAALRLSKYLQHLAQQHRFMHLFSFGHFFKEPENGHTSTIRRRRGRSKTSIFPENYAGAKSNAAASADPSLPPGRDSRSQFNDRFRLIFLNIQCYE
jgi:hypothetical protein